MTDSLHRLTRKHLATMARRRHVSGWHEMRKAELIAALEALPTEDDPSAFPATFPACVGEVSPSTENGHPPPWGNGQSLPRRGLFSGPLLRTSRREQDRFVAQAVSRHWIRAEWTLALETLQRVERALGAARHAACPALRLFDVSSDERITHSQTFVSDTILPADATEWFVQVDQPGGDYLLQLGIRDGEDQFHRLVSSERVQTGEPLSTCVSPVARQPTAESICRNGHKPFGRTTTIPLSVEAELVIRGTTHPQAVMAIANESVPVESDGAFESIRPLTDGRHVIPTTALSPDGRRQHTIVVALECHTKHLAPRGPEDE